MTAQDARKNTDAIVHLMMLAESDIGPLKLEIYVQNGEFGWP